MAIYKVGYTLNVCGEVFVEATTQDAAEAVARADLYKLVDGANVTENEIDVDTIVEIPDMPSLDEAVRDR